MEETFYLSHTHTERERYMSRRTGMHGNISSIHGYGTRAMSHSFLWGRKDTIAWKPAVLF